MNNEFAFDEIDYAPIDLCACFDPIFNPPQEVIDEWNRCNNDYCEEPEFEDTAIYVRIEGVDYLWVGKTLFKIKEHFSGKGKSVGALIEDVIQYSAHQGKK